MSPTRFFCSSIGRKVLMALTGLGLLLFVIAHMLGNLQIFLGRETFNEYAALIKGMPGPLWVARIGLVVLFLTHVLTAISLKRSNKAARPTEYRDMGNVQATSVSRYMLESGILILIFVVIHLLHFTIGALQEEYFHLVDAAGRHDVYSMVVRGFQHTPYSIGYIIAMLCLAAHLSHAISSVFQTLGFFHPRYTACIKQGSSAVAALIALGYIAVPTSVLLGIVGL